ncbi:MAG: phosphoribosylaminoimidazole-succinocarboxamide synthase [Cyclobacteriaceae bacterium]|nr:MAG: phosphoribosylaminoimidazole-succinocarboxamide synthase [Cyclobacteriaceae bacterium]
MATSVKETDFSFPQQEGFYRGKVRDVYIFPEIIAIVVSDRISAFDVVLPKAIPFKGQILNQVASSFLKATSDIVPNWLLATPHPQVAIGKRCRPYPVEMVIRGYLAGHAWREYQDGKRSICGVPLPSGLKESDPLPQPVITPSTKAASGHDQDISRAEIIQQGLVPEDQYLQMERYTKELFDRGTALAAARGLILVDTKYEFGNFNGEVTLIDEIHTPDSSRYFYADGYHDRQSKAEPQKQLSKEFVREWLMKNNFQGKPGQQIPEMTPEVVKSISDRYIELHDKLMGTPFVIPQDSVSIEEIKHSILEWFEKTEIRHNELP